MFPLLMAFLAVPFAAWAALLALAAQAPDGFEDQGGFHLGVWPIEAAEQPAGLADGI